MPQTQAPSPYSHLYDPDAERNLLGDLIHHPDRLRAVIDTGLTASHFASTIYAPIYDATVDLVLTNGQPIDAPSLRAELARIGRHPTPVTDHDIFDVFASGTGAWRRHAAHIQELAARRTGIAIANQLQQAYAEGTDTAPLVAELAGADIHGHRSRIDLLTTAELCALPPPTWLVDTLLPAGALTLAYSPPGGYKSFLAVDIASHIATGKPWHGRPVQQGRVLYVAAEGVAGMGKRVDAWCDHHGQRRDHLPIDWITQPVNLAGPNDAAILARHADGAALVIIDTLARCTPGVEENSAKDIGLVIANLDRIRNGGATILVLHHAGKDRDKGARGSTALKGAIDTELELGAGGKGTLTVKTTKQKDAPEAPPLAFNLQTVADSIVLDLDQTLEPGGEGGTWEGPTHLADAVVAHITDHGPRSGNQLRQEVKGRAKYIIQAAQLAVTDGRLVAEPGPNRAIRYRLADDQTTPDQEDLGAF